MLVVHVDFAVAPQNRPFAISTLREEAPIVRAMTGNLGYSVAVDPVDAGRVLLIHEWEGENALAAYRASETFRSVGAALFPHMVGKPSTRIFAATQIEG